MKCRHFVTFQVLWHPNEHVPCGQLTYIWHMSCHTPTHSPLYVEKEQQQHRPNVCLSKWDLILIVSCRKYLRAREFGASIWAVTWNVRCFIWLSERISLALPFRTQEIQNTIWEAPPWTIAKKWSQITNNI